jgi:hypothetical protein
MPVSYTLAVHSRGFRLFPEGGGGIGIAGDAGELASASTPVGAEADPQSPPAPGMIRGNIASGLPGGGAWGMSGHRVPQADILGRLAGS